MAEFQGYNFIDDYYESLVLEYKQGNRLAAYSEFSELQHDSQKDFLKFCDSRGYYVAYMYFNQFI